MNDKEFRTLLTEIGDRFYPHQVGSADGTWIATGTLLNDTSFTEFKKQTEKRLDGLVVHGDESRVRLVYKEPKVVVLKFPKVPRTHLILFLLTVLTTLLAGSVMAGGNPFSHPSDLFRGIPFSFTLLLILGTHEFGHYYFARKHHVDATLPYFIPAPTTIGTFGAFIKIKSPIYRKHALLEIGAAGPIAGFIVAVPALYIGLHLSTVIDLSQVADSITLGNSLLMSFLSHLVYPNLSEMEDILLHPVAFAGWIGLLVTMLNLLPIGQLDGGHIAYAILGRKYNLVAKLAFLSLIPLSYFSLNWLVWGGLILLIMRTTKHPPVMDVDDPPQPRDRKIAYLCLVIFILCFVPVPFEL